MNNACMAASVALGALLPIGCAFAQAGGRPEASDNSMENIIVHGTTGNREAARAELALVPGGASLIDLEDLRSRNVGSLADALRYVPGIWSVSDTGNDGIYFSSRGSNLDATDYDMNGIKLLQDGLPVTTADGNNHNRVIDPLAAEYAIAARGANALKYGASTLGGAVDFISPTAHTTPQEEVLLTTGSNGQVLTRGSAGRTFNDSLDALVTLESKSWDGYRAHNEQDRSGLYANTGLQISDRLSTRFFLTWLENDQRLPGALTLEQLETDPNQASSGAIAGNCQLNVDTLRLANKTALQLGASRNLELGFSIEHQSLYHPIVDRVMVDFDGPGPAPPVEVFSLLIDTDHEDIGGMVRYSWNSTTTICCSA